MVLLLLFEIFEKCDICNIFFFRSVFNIPFVYRILFLLPFLDRL